jgi:hypothetical protein
MKLSYFWETNTASATNDIINILQKHEVHYRVYKSLPLVPVLSYS